MWGRRCRVHETHEDWRAWKRLAPDLLEPKSLEPKMATELCFHVISCSFRGGMDVFAPLLECPSSLPEIGLLRLPCETRMHLHIQPPCVSLHPIQEALHPIQECLRNGMFRLRFHVAYLADKLLLGPLGHRRFDSALHVWLPLLTAPEMQPTHAFVNALFVNAQRCHHCYGRSSVDPLFSRRSLLEPNWRRFFPHPLESK